MQRGGKIKALSQSRVMPSVTTSWASLLPLPEQLGRPWLKAVAELAPAWPGCCPLPLPGAAQGCHPPASTSEPIDRPLWSLLHDACVFAQDEGHGGNCVTRVTNEKRIPSLQLRMRTSTFAMHASCGEALGSWSAPRCLTSDSCSLNLCPTHSAAAPAVRAGGDWDVIGSPCLGQSHWSTSPLG